MPSGLGLFQPSEIQYRNPGQYRDTLAAVGNKEADYLASMDQFFANLDESKRQFDLSSAQKQSQFEASLSFEQEKLDWQSEENAYNRSSQESMSSEQLGAQKEIASQNTSLRQQELDMAKEKNEYIQELYANEETRRQETQSAAGNIVSSSYGKQSYDSSSLSPTDYQEIYSVDSDYYNPYGSSGLPDWLYY